MKADAARVAAVTGGTGFLGRYITTALAASGYHVRILVRREPKTRPAAWADLDVVRGDLADRGALARLVEGAHAVVHAAALTNAPGEAEFHRVNVEGTGNLVRTVAACAASARFVMVSSMAAREPALSPYAQTKRAGEELLAIVPGSSLDWVIVRPCPIYGPWDRATLVFFRAVGWRLVPCPAVAGARIALIHARDAAHAIASLCGAGPTHQTYEISDARAEGYFWREIMRTAAGAMGVRAVAVPVPGALVRGLAALSSFGTSLARRAPLLSPGKAREILHADWASSVDRQPSRALWRPEIALPSGFAETIRWYRNQGWLPGGGSSEALRVG